MRPMLRPGMHVLRRDVRTLQLGLEWPGIAAVHDVPAVRAVLEAVDGYRDVSGVLLAAEAKGVPAVEAREALDALTAAGALVDQSFVRPAGVDDATWSAMWLLAGPLRTAEDVLRSRGKTHACITGSGRIAELIENLLAAEQVPLTSDPADATLMIVVADQEPPRSDADDAMRRGVPFLCVGVRELVGLVGPFVLPGRTACLRCIDLSWSQHDPCWTTLIESARARPAVRTACPPTLAAMVSSYAAQEVVVWASGAMPASCGSLVEIPHGLGAVQTIPFHPQPVCGCGWGQRHETIGA